MPQTTHWVHIGQRYGRLRVVGQEQDARRHYWVCQCDCGERASVYKYFLLKGLTTSCGCRAQETRTRHGFTTHASKARVYRIWQGMWERCRNPKNSGYARYGAQGITVCDRWKDFSQFLEDMGLPPSTKHSIDRMDSNGGYEPSNVRWATHKEQNRNMRSNVWIALGGERRILTDWARGRGLYPETVRKRLRLGWTVEEALEYDPESDSVPGAQIGSVA